MFTDTVPPTTLRPLPTTVTGKLGGGGVASSASFAPAARLHQRAELRRVQPPARQLRLDGLRQREVHVVAAEQEVLADRVADEREFAPLLAGANQAEVGRAAADVHDQAPHPGLEHPGFLGRVRAEPRVERRLRLFEQRHVLQAGLLRGLGGEVAGDVVERRRHGDHHRLLFELVFRLAVGAAFHASTMCLRYFALTSSGRGAGRPGARPTGAAARCDRRPGG
jgi:hypothetical protein